MPGRGGPLFLPFSPSGKPLKIYTVVDERFPDLWAVILHTGRKRVVVIRADLQPQVKQLPEPPGLILSPALDESA